MQFSPPRRGDAEKSLFVFQPLRLRVAAVKSYAGILSQLQEERTKGANHQSKSAIGNRKSFAGPLARSWRLSIMYQKKKWLVV